MLINSYVHFRIIFLKNFLNDVFFKLRLNFAVKLLSFKKSAGYLKNLKPILHGLKNEGYYKVVGYYSDYHVSEIINANSNILDNLEEINKTLPADKKIHSATCDGGGIKISNTQHASNTMKIYSFEFFFILLSLLFYWKIKLPTCIYQLRKPVEATDNNLTTMHGNTNSFTSGRLTSDDARNGPWHVDGYGGNNTHYLKCIVLLDDTTPEYGGETQIILNSKKKLNFVKPAFLQNGTQIHPWTYSKNTLNKIVSENGIKSLYGKKGDLIFMDVCHLHRATSLKKGIRKVLWFHFEP